MSSPIPPVAVAFTASGDDAIVQAAKRVQAALDKTGQSATAAAAGAEAMTAGFRRAAQQLDATSQGAQAWSRGLQALEAQQNQTAQAAARLARGVDPIAAAMANSASGTARFADGLRALKAQQDAAAAAAAKGTAAVHPMAAAMARSASGSAKWEEGLRRLATQQQVSGKAGEGAATGMRRFETAVLKLGFGMVGLEGTTGRLGEALLTMATGGVVAVGVATGLALIGAAYEDLTKKTREARKATEDFAANLAKAGQTRADELNPAAAARRAFLGGDATKGETEGEGLQKRIDRLQRELAKAKRGVEVVNGKTGEISFDVDEKKVERLTTELNQAYAAAVEVGHRDLDATEANARLLAAAQLDAARQGIAGRLAAEQAGTRAEDQRNQTRFAKGLESLRDYYQRRIAIARDATADEVAALVKERDLVANRHVEGKTPAEQDADRVKRATEVAAIDARIAAVQTAGKQTSLDLTEQQRVAEKALAEERLSSEQQILQAQGRTYAAALLGIEDQVRKRRELLEKEGVTATSRDQDVEHLRQVLTLRAQAAKADQRLQMEQEVQTAQGNTLQAALIGIQQQVQKRRELLANDDSLSPEQREADIRQFERLLTLRAKSADVERQVGIEMAAMDRDRQDLQNQVTTGKLGEKKGEEQIAALELQRLPTLHHLADEAMRLAVAVDDPALVEQAQALGAQLGTIAAQADLAGQRTAKFAADTGRAVGDSVSGMLTEGLTKLGQVTSTTVEPAIDKAGNLIKDRFGNTIERVTTDVYGLGDAFLDMARRIVQGLEQIAATNLSNSIASGVGGFIASIFSKPLLLATGGVVPGSGSGDTVPAMLTPGEFVINKAATARHFDLLAEINQGIHPVRPVSYGPQRFASGGLVTSPARHGRSTVELVVPEGFGGRVLADDDVVTVVVRNRKTIGKALGVKG